MGALGLGAVTSYPLLSSCDWPNLLANLISLPFESGFPSPSLVYQFFISSTQVNSDSGMYNFLSDQFFPSASPVSIRVWFCYAFPRFSFISEFSFPSVVAKFLFLKFK